MSDFVSPASPLQKYTVSDYTKGQRTAGFSSEYLTDFDRRCVNIVRTTGAAAFFQLEQKRKDHNKLKALCRTRIFHFYHLHSTFGHPMYVATWDKMEVRDILKALALTQLLLMSDFAYQGNSLIIGLKNYRYFNIRSGETVNPTLINSYPLGAALLIEDFRPILTEIKVPCHIFTDRDLFLNGSVVAHSPDTLAMV